MAPTSQERDSKEIFGPLGRRHAHDTVAVASTRAGPSASAFHFLRLRETVKQRDDDEEPFPDPESNPTPTPTPDQADSSLATSPFVLRGSILLPPHLPLSTGSPEPITHHEISRARTAEILFIVSLILLSLIVGVGVGSMLRCVLRKKGVRVWELRGGKFARLVYKRFTRTLREKDSAKGGSDEKLVFEPVTIMKTGTICANVIFEPPSLPAGRKPKAASRVKAVRTLQPIPEESDESVQDDSNQSLDGSHKQPISSDSEEFCRAIFTASEKADACAELALRAGIESIEKRGNGPRSRVRRDTESSATASQSDQEWIQFDTASEGSSSRSSIVSGSLEEEVPGDVVFEVRRAQTKSMEVKKGILISWTNGNAAPALPIPHETSIPTIPSLNSNQDGSLPTPGPDQIVTEPSASSLTTVGSSTSSVSVDLNDFPAPPSLLNRPVTCISTEIDKSPLFCEDDVTFNQWKSAEGEEKRSTVMQVIMMYGGF